MKIDLPNFIVDKKDFALGNNAYDEYPTGGFSVDSDRVNVFKKPGFLHVGPALVQQSSNLVVKPTIAWGLGKGALSADLIALGINNNNNGYFYSVNDNGAYTQVALDDTHNYEDNFSDIAWYKGSYYVTSKSDMAKIGAGGDSPDFSFWTVTKSKASLDTFSPHPLIVYGSILYQANGEWLNQLDGTTADDQVLHIDSNYVITAMEIYNNLIFIAADPYYNASGQYHGGQKLYTWNGYAGSWLDEWFVDYRINAMKVFQGVLYVWTNTFFGYFNGSVLVPLYPIRNDGGATAHITKHKITITDKSLFWADGTQVIRFGGLIEGSRKAFFNQFTSPTGQRIGAILGHKDKQLIVAENGSSTGKSYLSSDVNGSTFVSEVSRRFSTRYFNREVKLRYVTIEMDSMTSNDYLTLEYYTDKGVLESIGQLAAMVGVSRYTFDVKSSPMTRSITPRLRQAGPSGVRSIQYFYETSELKANK